MRIIPLTQNKNALVDNKDFKKINKYKWCAANNRTTFYAVAKIKGKTVRMHKLLLPGVDEVDHRDGNGLNNQRYNIRPATRSQNCQNRSKLDNMSSNFKGVSWAKRSKAWRSTIYIKGRQFHLGYFKSEIEAAKAYNEAAKKYHGEFARLNLI